MGKQNRRNTRRRTNKRKKIMGGESKFVKFDELRDIITAMRTADNWFGLEVQGRPDLKLVQNSDEFMGESSSRGGDIAWSGDDWVERRGIFGDGSGVNTVGVTKINEQGARPSAPWYRKYS
jgi:hypothetical protein